MHDESNSLGGGYCERVVLRQKRRDHFATPLACLAAPLHVFATSAVLAWYFVIVPRLKFETDQLRKVLSWSVFSQIAISDFVIDHSYFVAPSFVLLVIVLSVFSFRAHRWLARHLGLTSASAVVVAFLIVFNILLNYTILRQALP